MSNFRHGYVYPLNFVFPYEGSKPIVKADIFPVHSKPIIKVKMLPLYGDGKEPVIVSGMMDTGAGKTFLDFETANILSIDNPKQDHEGKAIVPGTIHSVTNESIEYYTHKVLVYIEGERSFHFPLRVRFAEKIAQNIFGRDWLMVFCLAFDSQRVHLFRP